MAAALLATDATWDTPDAGVERSGLELVLGNGGGSEREAMLYYPVGIY